MKIFTSLAAISLAAAIMLPASQAFAVDEHFLSESAVIGGYDAVAYHTVGAPRKGLAEFSSMYQGATWQFASAENKALFDAEPAKYAPAYGGWCSAGASKGKKVPTKPDLFAIVDGQLYLNSSPKAHNDLFLAKTDEVIAKGEANWKLIFATPSGDL
jgi:YHS domain-containing protein